MEPVVAPTAIRATARRRAWGALCGLAVLAALETWIALFVRPLESVGLARLAIFGPAFVFVFLSLQIRRAMDLPFHPDADVLVLYPETLKELLGNGLPSPIPLDEVCVDDVQAVTWKAEEVPGRLHAYELRLVTQAGRRLKVQSIRQPSFVYWLLGSGAVGIRAGIVSDCATRALSFWDANECNFRTPDAATAL